MGRGKGRRPIARRSVGLALAAGGIAALAIGGVAFGSWLWHRPSVGEIRRLVAAHDNDAGLRVAADLLASNPANPQVLETLGTLYAGLCDEATGEPDRPRASAAVRRIAITLHNALRSGPDSALGEEVFGEFALAAGNDEMAVTALQRAETLGVPADRVDVPLVLALLRAGRFQDVLQATQPEATSSPRHRAMLLMLQARAHLGLSQIDEAREGFGAVLAIDPDNVDALSRLGMLALWQDRDESAAADCLTRARQAGPDASPTLRLAGEYTYATGDYGGSAAAYGELVRRGAPETFDPIPPTLGAARALIYEGDVAAAQAALDASPLPAADPSVRYYRALLAFRAGEFGRAVNLAQSLDTVLANYPPLDLLLGGALLADDLPAMAAAHLAHYVAEVPDDSAARSLLQKAQRGITDPMAAEVSQDELLVAFGFPPSTGTGAARKDGL